VLAPYRPMFAEEPVQPGDADAMRMVSDRTRVPIATGERLIDRRDFEDLCTRRAVAIVQPDLCHCGGIWEGRKIAAMAETAMMGVAPHLCAGPVLTAATLQLDATLTNLLIQELYPYRVPEHFGIVDQPPELTVRGGRMPIPDRPGHGVALDEARVAPHLFARVGE